MWLVDIGIDQRPRAVSREPVCHVAAFLPLPPHGSLILAVKQCRVLYAVALHLMRVGQCTSSTIACWRARNNEPGGWVRGSCPGHGALGAHIEAA